MLNLQEIYNILPLNDIPFLKFEEVREIWDDHLLNTNPGHDLEKIRSWSYNRITVPCFHVSGWYDCFNWSATHNFLNMRENGGSEHACRSQHMLLGPWAHGPQLPAFIGDIHFGAFAGTPGARISEQHIAFFNKYLRGMNDKLPAIRYFTMCKNIWQTAETWPLHQTQWQRFFLHSKGKANTSAGDGRLSYNEPNDEPPDVFVYNPDLPVATTGGCVIPEAGLIPGPRDQKYIELRSDVLCYTTAELEEDTEVTGPLQLKIFASTSARDTDFTAKLVDVHPDGRAYNVADGIIRARYRKSVFKRFLTVFLSSSVIIAPSVTDLIMLPGIRCK